MMDLDNFFIVFFGISGTLIGWFLNQSSMRQNELREKQIDRFDVALSEFYWPLYYEMQNLLYFMSLETRNEKMLSSIVYEISNHLKNHMGSAFPKKVISQPLLIIIPKLLRGITEGNTTKYVSLESLKVIHSIVEARMMSLTKKLNVFCGEDETDRYTFAMYQIAINHLNHTRDNEWFTELDWWSKKNKLKLISRKNKYKILDKFYDVVYNTDIMSPELSLNDDTLCMRKKSDASNIGDYVQWLQDTNMDNCFPMHMPPPSMIATDSDTIIKNLTMKMRYRNLGDSEMDENKEISDGYTDMNQNNV